MTTLEHTSLSEVKRGPLKRMAGYLITVVWENKEFLNYVGCSCLVKYTMGMWMEQ